MVETIWLHRPSRDGGIDYVCFRAQQGAVEILEGSHLPPQMPLIKTRISLGSAQARDRRWPGNSSSRRQYFPDPLSGNRSRRSY